jgi:integral membrane protein (TIGR01906 family)
MLIKFLKILGVILIPLVILLLVFSNVVYNDSIYLKYSNEIENKELYIDQLISYFEEEDGLTYFTVKDVVHLKDVTNLINSVLAVFWICLMISLFILFYLFYKKKFTQILDMFIFSFLVFLVIFFIIWLIPFENLFLSFHLISFDNDLWLMNANESLLIQLFPETFFESIFMLILTRTFFVLLVLFLVSLYLKFYKFKKSNKMSGGLKWKNMML